MEKYMKEALYEAQKAFLLDEVPVGAIIVKEDQIIARSYNQRESKKNPLSHAEIEVINLASQKLGRWRLDDCDLYVTLEPCMMCTGAIQQSQIKRVIYGAKNSKESFLSEINNFGSLNYYPEIVANVLENESSNLLKEYFKRKRESNILVKNVNFNERLLEKYYNLRKEVFIKEQGVPFSLEFDEYDKIYDINKVMHCVAVKNNKVLGTMRLIFDRESNILYIGRITVDKKSRKCGIGSKLLSYANRIAKNQGFKELQLSAQVNALGFYQNNGYETYGDVFLDAYIKHIKMKKKLL